MPTTVRSTVFGCVASAVIALLGTWNAPLGAQNTQSAEKPPFSRLLGTLTDSVHNGPLTGAVIIVEGAQRSAVSDTEGRFVVDSIPPGPHRVMVIHPVLDTIGLVMRTPAYQFTAGQAHGLDLAVPPSEQLAAQVCTRAQRTRGPAVMLGFVRDPETKGAALGAKVSLVYQTTDTTGKKSQTLREAVVDSSGYYRICGIPAEMEGKVQVFRNGVSSGEVPVSVIDGLALRAFSIVSQSEAVAGVARVTGKVLDKMGRPIEGARVTLQGGGASVLTRQNGEFVMDSLPPGTQALTIRKLGFTPTEAAIELSSSEPANTTIRMEDFVPTLEVMRVEAAQDKALADIGFISRKNAGMGYFLDGNQINRDALTFSDVMRNAPGLRFTPLPNGRSYYISDSRNAGGGCVNYYVDGTQWQTMTPGDIDEFVRPSELVAVELYRGTQTPPQFSPPGQSGCTTIVAWTRARVRTQPNANENPSRRP